MAPKAARAAGKASAGASRSAVAPASAVPPASAPTAVISAVIAPPTKAEGLPGNPNPGISVPIRVGVPIIVAWAGRGIVQRAIVRGDGRLVAGKAD